MTKHQEPQGGVADTISEAYDKVSDTVASAYQAAREKASDAAHGTSLGIDANPFLALAGGIAIGAIVGALLPRGEQESDLLAPVGERIADAAKSAIAAAKSAGTDALSEAGISQDNLRVQSSKVFDGLFKAAGAAGAAAFAASRDSTAG